MFCVVQQTVERVGIQEEIPLNERSHLSSLCPLPFFLVDYRIRLMLEEEWLLPHGISMRERWCEKFEQGRLFPV